MLPIDGFTDEDSRRVILRALRMLAVVTAVAVPVVCWKMSWQSAVLLLVGAGISAAGLWKWLRLMSLVMAKMDSTEGDGKARPMGRVLAGFFLTLGLSLAAL